MSLLRLRLRRSDQSAALDFLGWLIKGGASKFFARVREKEVWDRIIGRQCKVLC